MATAKERRQEKRKIATIFVDEVNSNTFCSYCGKQPIEWHREEHEQDSNSRVSSLRTQGASVERIKLEMSLCTPLCRSCHMEEDGRMDILRVSGKYKKGETYVPKLPCSVCGREVKPLRRGLCYKHYNELMGIRQPK